MALQLLPKALGRRPRVTAQESDDGRKVFEGRLGFPSLPEMNGLLVCSYPHRHIALQKPQFQPSASNVIP